MKNRCVEKKESLRETRCWQGLIKCPQTREAKKGNGIGGRKSNLSASYWQWRNKLAFAVQNKPDHPHGLSTWQRSTEIPHQITLAVSPPFLLAIYWITFILSALNRLSCLVIGDWITDPCCRILVALWDEGYLWINITVRYFQAIKHQSVKSVEQWSLILEISALAVSTPSGCGRPIRQLSQGS